MIDVKKIALDMFGSIEWVTFDRGFIKCPGFSSHTGKNSKKDCRIITSGAPTVFCLHTSCKEIVDDANLKLRRACATGEGIEPRIITFEEKQKMKEAYAKKKIEFDLQSLASVSRETVFSKFTWDPADMWEESPVYLTNDPIEDWKLFLRLFADCDVLWNGMVMHSGNPRNTINFKPVSEWKESGPVGNFTCGSTFKPGSFSRSNENVEKRKFLVIESDTLSQEKVCAIFNFCRKFMRLRAVVYTGGKSLHAWMDFPSESTFKVLEQLLPNLGCDQALFKPSQPVRMPGVMRNDKIQSLLYLNL